MDNMDICVGNSGVQMESEASNTKYNVPEIRQKSSEISCVYNSFLSYCTDSESKTGEREHCAKFQKYSPTKMDIASKQRFQDSSIRRIWTGLWASFTNMVYLLKPSIDK